MSFNHNETPPPPGKLIPDLNFREGNPTLGLVFRGGILL